MPNLVPVPSPSRDLVVIEDPVSAVDREARAFTALCAIATAKRAVLIARLEDRGNVRR